MDVLWMRLSRRPGDPAETLGRFDRGCIFVMINREEYFQCALVIPKGGFDGVRRAGLEAFRGRIVQMMPFLTDRVGQLESWDQVKLLTVKVDRLRRWYRPGLLCVGDAAHAMSPLGGVGINLAIQDAVAVANLLWRPLSSGRLTLDDLRAVQRRRAFPTRFTQRLQVVLQNRVIGRVLHADRPMRMPLALRLFQWLPFLRRIPAYLIGVGIRPEHVQSPEAP
jgi:2-polyprenyl-6-methoxyphenol hydroxylase-like FAD-dependent oxidoreductase